MSDTNDNLNWDDDKRTFSRLAAWIQRRFQIGWLPHLEPPSITVALFPPCLFANLPLFWRQPKPYLIGAVVDPAGKPIVPVLHLRLGWRRDMSTGRFYPSAAAKIEDRTKLW